MTSPILTVYQSGVNQVSGDQLNTFVQGCSTVSTLRSFIGVDTMQVTILGFTAPNDGGQGDFYWNATGIAPDDGGITTVVPNGAASGEWTRVGSGNTSTLVNSVTAADTTLTITPTTGNVTARLNLAKANTWTAAQNFPTGTVAVTQSPGDNTTNLATTAFVTAAVGGGGSVNQTPSITGFYPTSIAGTATTAAITIAKGITTTLDGTALISKSSSTSWLVSNGNAINGFSGGTTLPNSTTIHFFACSGGSGTGTFASASLTPTFPTGYTTSTRRIFSLLTSSTGTFPWNPATEVSGGGLYFPPIAPTTDVNVTSLGTTATLYTLSVPTGIQVQPIVRVAGGSNASEFYVTSPSSTDTAPNVSLPTSPGYTGFDYTSNNAFVYTPFLVTNTSGQIRARASAINTTFIAITDAFIDFRRV